MKEINYMEPAFDSAEIDAVDAYMRSGGWLTEFKKTREFERSIADFIGATNCSIMCNGTMTLVAALMACGIGQGDEVIVPDFTMSATSHAVVMVGAAPVFVDVEPNTLCIDFDLMQRAVTSKTKAVMLVELNGRYPEQFQKIIDYCESERIWLIEDAAQALGSNFQGKSLGTFGNIGSFSFSMPKIITTGQGGAVITDDEALFEKMLRIRDFGREKTGSDHYVMIGGNFKFTDMQAVVGIEQMKKLPSRVERKKEMGRLYDKYLDGMDEIQTVYNNYDDTAPCFIEVLCRKDKQGLMKYLKDNGVNTREFYPPLHSEPAYSIKDRSYPNTEEISSQGFWLPSSVKLSDEDIYYICNLIKNYY